MSYSLRTVSIIVALLVSGLFITVAYILSGPGAREVSAENTEELLKAYAVKDTDADGLPDWQESLYKTDPNDASSVKEGMTDGEAVAAGLVEPKFESEELPQTVTTATIPGTAPAPQSLTEKFSRVFFERYMNASGGQPMSEASQQALLSSLMSTFTVEASDVLSSKYTIGQVSQSPAVDVIAYAGAVEQILVMYQAPAGAEDFVALTQAYVEKGDESAGPKLQALSRSFRNRADALLRTTAPTALVTAHLQSARAFDTLAKISAATAEYKKDPLTLLGALSLYQPMARQQSRALETIGAAIRRNGEPAVGAPGSMILQIVDLTS